MHCARAYLAMPVVALAVPRVVGPDQAPVVPQLRGAAPHVHDDARVARLEGALGRVGVAPLHLELEFVALPPPDGGEGGTKDGESWVGVRQPSGG